MHFIATTKDGEPQERQLSPLGTTPINVRAQLLSSYIRNLHMVYNFIYLIQFFLYNTQCLTEVSIHLLDPAINAAFKPSISQDTYVHLTICSELSQLLFIGALSVKMTVAKIYCIQFIFFLILITYHLSFAGFTVSL